MNRVLITGGAGFIGSHLCEQLQKLGQEIVIFDNFSTGKVKNLFSLKPTPLVVIYEVGTAMWGNLPDIKFDTLIHLAAPVSVEESYIYKPLSEEPLVGLIKYPNKYLISQGVTKGTKVTFKPESEYEFNIDGKKLYRMFDHQITMML